MNINLYKDLSHEVGYDFTVTELSPNIREKITKLETSAKSQISWKRIIILFLFSFLVIPFFLAIYFLYLRGKRMSPYKVLVKEAAVDIKYDLDIKHKIQKIVPAGSTSVVQQMQVNPASTSVVERNIIEKQRVFIKCSHCNASVEQGIMKCPNCGGVI